MTMSLLRACFLPFSAALLLTACVANEPASLGDLETSDGSSSSSSSSSDESGTTAGEVDAVCDQLVGTTFSSVEEIVCVPAQEDEEPVYCHSWIELAEDGAFLWVEGDYGQGGAYTCEGGVLTLEGLDVDFSFDPATGILTWDGDEYQPDPLCPRVVGTTFVSVEELECGLGPDGPVPCHWQITFEEDGDLVWTYSDVGESGTYACQGGNLLVDGVDVMDGDIAFDPATGILTWDGVEYEVEPG
jgi:hypothetical protein